MTDARVALIDAIASDMQRGRSYYDVVIRQLLALRKTFTDPPPYTGLVLASDLTAAEARIVELEAKLQKSIHSSVEIVADALAQIDAAEAVADRLRPDALRYRWLRENAEDITWPTGQVCGLQFLIDGRARFDAVIDRELTGTPVADGEITQAADAKGGRECDCSLRGRLVGEGCEICNPDYARDHDGSA